MPGVSAHSISRAILFALIAYFAFSVSDAAGKCLTADYNVSTIIFLGPGAATVLLFAFLIRRYGAAVFKTPSLRFHLARAGLVAINAHLLLYGIAHVNFAAFYALVFGSPLLVVLLSKLVLKENIGIHRLAASCVGFTGVLVVAGAKFEAQPLAVIVLLISIVFIALGVIMVRQVRREDPLPLHVFFMMAGLTAGGLPGFVMDPQFPATTLHASVFLLGVVSAAAGQFFFSKAYQNTPATSIIAPFHYTQIIWGVVIGYVAFAEIPSGATVLGIAIIIGSGLYIVYRELVHRPRLIVQAGLARLFFWRRRRAPDNA